MLYRLDRPTPKVGRRGPLWPALRDVAADLIGPSRGSQIPLSSHVAVGELQQSVQKGAGNDPGVYRVRYALAIADDPVMAIPAPMNSERGASILATLPFCHVQKHLRALHGVGGSEHGMAKAQYRRLA